MAQRKPRFEDVIENHSDNSDDSSDDDAFVFVAVTLRYLASGM